jgi:hypothetical protein
MQETDKEHANFSCVTDVGIENYNRKPVWGKQKMQEMSAVNLYT